MHDIIVIGGSAGAIEAVLSLVRQLPARLSAALFVVIHFPTTASSVLPQLLTRAGKLPAHHASDGEAIVAGQIYVAPPDFHLLVRDGFIQLTRGPRENRHRPAIDPLFRSAALAYGSRVVGVLLSGLQADGTAGMHAIKARGGVTICQDPTDALYPDMPRNAIEQVGVEYELEIEKIAATLSELTMTNNPTTNSDALLNQLEQETDIAALKQNSQNRIEPPGDPSGYGCPACGGVLWEMKEGEVLRFRCRVGHAYSNEDLMVAQESAIEEAMWSAMRALEEHASLLSRTADRARGADKPQAAKLLEGRAEDEKERAALLLNVLTGGTFPGAATGEREGEREEVKEF